MLTRLSFSGLALGLLIYLSSFAAFTQPLSLIEKGRWGSPEYESAYNIGNFVIAKSFHEVIDVFDRRLEGQASLVNQYKFNEGGGEIYIFKDQLVLAYLGKLEFYKLDDKGKVILLEEVVVESSSETCFAEDSNKLYFLGRRYETGTWILNTVVFNGEERILSSQEFRPSFQVMQRCELFASGDDILFINYTYEHGTDKSNAVALFVKISNVGSDELSLLESSFKLDDNVDLGFGSDIDFVNENYFVMFSRYYGSLFLFKIEPDGIELKDSLPRYQLTPGQVTVWKDEIHMINDKHSVYKIDENDKLSLVREIDLENNAFFHPDITNVRYDKGKIIVTSRSGIFEVTLENGLAKEVEYFYNQSGIIYSSYSIGHKAFVQKWKGVYIVDFKDGYNPVKLSSIAPEPRAGRLFYFRNRILNQTGSSFHLYDAEDDNLSLLQSYIPGCDTGTVGSMHVIIKDKLYTYCYSDRKVLVLNISSDSSLLETPQKIDISSLDYIYERPNNIVFMEVGGEFVIGSFLGVENGLKVSFYTLNEEEGFDKVNSIELPGAYATDWRVTDKYFVFPNISNTNVGEYVDLTFSLYRINGDFTVEKIIDSDGILNSDFLYVDDHIIIENNRNLDIYFVNNAGGFELVASQENHYEGLEYAGPYGNSRADFFAHSWISEDITLFQLNYAPILQSVNVSVHEDGQYTWDLKEADKEGDIIGVEITAVPNSGHVEFLSELASLRYTPSADFFGADTLSIRLSDEHGNFKDYQLAIEVQAVDDPPRPQAKSVSAKAGTTHKGQLANQDIDGDTLIYAVLQATSNGALTLNANGSYSYTPKTGFSGTDKFTYQVSDSNGNTAQSEVQISVAKASTPPPATSSDSSGGGTLSWLLLALLWLSYLHQRRWVTKCYIGTGNS